MKINRHSRWFTALLILFGVINLWSQKNVASLPLLMDSHHMSSTKKRLAEGDPDLKTAYEKLLTAADAMLEEGPFAVTEKTKLPPSGNPHDYASYSRYWWPDPTKKDGLPYIRRDGETNPQSQSLDASDRQRIGALGENTETLGLAYYFSGEEKYAKKASQLLRVWFLDPETRMNPNLNHAQCRPGHNTGSKSGVLDGRLMLKAFEASLLIGDSNALSAEEKQGLKNWAEEYFDWLTNNQMALKEAASKNNHGSYYDLQVIYLALFIEKEEQAKNIAQNFYANRVLKQIQPDGTMPEEIARTRPLFYSIYNLHAMFLVAHLAKKVEADIWKANDPSSRLSAGLDFLVPYAHAEKSWPSPEVGEVDRMALFPILLMANRAYPSKDYIQFIDDLPLEKRKRDRALLAFPLIR